MTFKTEAIKSFEAAQEIAEANGNAALEHLAAGLIELTKMLGTMKRDIDTIESKIK